MAFEKILSGTTIEQLFAGRTSPQKLISVTPQTTLAETLSLMNKNMIASLPVLDSGKCIGIVDNVDIITYLAKQFENIREWLSNSSASVENVLSTVKVSEVVDNAHGDPLVVTEEHADVMSLMKFFISGWSHRCVVKTKEGYLICSQYDVIKFLTDAMGKEQDLYDIADSLQLLDKLKSRSVTQETVSIASQESIFTALDRMLEKQVRGMAVVDEIEEGKIIGNFSATDLLQVNAGQFKDFSLTVVEFLEKYSPASLNPVTIEAVGTSLANLLTLFSTLGVHRLWIVDSTSEVQFPLGVVTQSDALKLVSELF